MRSTARQRIAPCDATERTYRDRAGSEVLDLDSIRRRIRSWLSCRSTARRTEMRACPKSPLLAMPVVTWGRAAHRCFAATLVKSHFLLTDETNFQPVANDVAVKCLATQEDRSVVRCSIQLSYGRRRERLICGGSSVRQPHDKSVFRAVPSFLHHDSQRKVR